MLGENSYSMIDGENVKQRYVIALIVPLRSLELHSDEYRIYSIFDSVWGHLCNIEKHP